MILWSLLEYLLGEEKIQRRPHTYPLYLDMVPLVIKKKLFNICDTGLIMYYTRLTKMWKIARGKVLLKKS